MPQFRSNLLVVAAALVDAKGHVLVQQRPAGKSHAGLWEFPGGKIEPGETPGAALVRELKEELGISVESTDLHPASFAAVPDDGRTLILLLYRCERWEGVPTPIDAHALRWVAPADLRSLPMPEADIPLAETLASSIPAPRR